MDEPNGHNVCAFACIQPYSVVILSHKALREFVANPNRDASDTIGGFVYQVDVTLLHWLGLQPGEILELERGEDIDVIQNWLKEGNLRTLEQIKRRASSLTLRSSEAITAVANFCEHKSLNPDAKLRFRYITTSKVGGKRLAPFGDSHRSLGVTSPGQGQ